MRTLNKEQADPLVAAICRGQLWATPEETAAWLKTETGQLEICRYEPQKIVGNKNADCNTVYCNGPGCR